MAIQLQVRRGNTAQNDAFTGAAGEITVDTDNKSIRVHDGSTAGGTELARSNQIDSVLTKVLTGLSGDVVLSTAEAENTNHEYTGAPSAAVNIIVPATVHNFTAENLTSGGFTITVKTAAGSGVAIGAAKTIQLYNNGTNVEDSNSSKLTGDIGVIAGNVQQVDQAITATVRAATTTLGTTLNHTLSATGVAITAFNGVAGVTYRCTALGTGLLTYHATNLIIKQGLASIETAAGDTFDVYMLTATTCEVRNYVRAAVPGFQCAAWVNFNGVGAVAIRDSGNVSSITDNATGNYTVNFATALPHANYAILSGAGDTGLGSGPIVFSPYGSAPTVNGFSILVTDGATTYDPVVCSLSVFA